MRVRGSPLIASLVASATIPVVGVSAVPAYADTTTWTPDGNCNNWHPHGWSDLSWSGGPSNANGDAEAQLYQWNYSTSSYWLKVDDTKDPSTGGSSGSANADAYESTYEYGTGKWQVQVYYAYEYGSNDQEYALNYDYADCG